MMEMAVRLPSIHLEGDAIRLVVCRESDQRLLFDSATILPSTSDGGGSVRGRLSPCGRFLRHGSCDDQSNRHRAQSLFSALQVSSSSSSSSSSSLLSDGGVMEESTSGGDSDSQYSTVRSMEGLRRSLCEAPEWLHTIASSSISSEMNDRPISPIALSHNRRLRMAMTSCRLDECCSSSNTGTPRSRLSSNSSGHDEPVINVSTAGQRLGMAVLLPYAIGSFLFQHMLLIDVEMERLQIQLQKAFLAKTRFLALLYQAWCSFIEAFTLLHEAPRLRQPVWLSLLREEEREIIGGRFCRIFIHLAERLETKEHRFFLSRLLSALLMHHLAWVASVSYPSGEQQKPPMSCTVSDKRRLSYNAFWAQHLELTGCVGSVVSQARTVIVGNDEMVLQLIFLLSYFIRSSHVESVSECMDRSCTCTTAFSDLSFSSSSGAESPDSACAPHSQTIPDLFKNGSTVTDYGGDMGRSLFGGISSRYGSHFVLSGLLKNETNMTNALSAMIDHVKSEPQLPSSYSNIVTESEIDRRTSSVLIIADCVDMTVKILSNGDEDLVLDECSVDVPCQLIMSIVDQTVKLRHLDCPDHFLLSHIEERLRDILLRSISLAELLRAETNSSLSAEKVALNAEKVALNAEKVALNAEKVAQAVDCETSDLRLLLNVATVFWPNILVAD